MGGGLMSKQEEELVAAFRELTEKHQEEALYLMKKLAEVARLTREGTRGETG